MFRGGGPAAPGQAINSEALAAPCCTCKLPFFSRTMSAAWGDAQLVQDGGCGHRAALRPSKVDFLKLQYSSIPRQQRFVLGGFVAEPKVHVRRTRGLPENH